MQEEINFYTQNEVDYLDNNLEHYKYTQDFIIGMIEAGKNYDMDKFNYCLEELALMYDIKI